MEQVKTHRKSKHKGSKKPFTFKKRAGKTFGKQKKLRRNK